MLVRNVTMEEADQLYPLICLSVRKELDREQFQTYLMQALEKPTRRILLGYDGGIPVGFVDAEVRASLSDCALVGCIHSLFVREECRGRGVGTGLLMNLSTQMKKMGCTMMTATSSRVNVRSQEFLEQRGFLRSQYAFTRDLT